MKNALKKLLATALVMLMLATFCSCSLFTPKPETDFSDAKKALENAGYTATVGLSDYDADYAIKNKLYASKDAGDYEYIYIIEFKDSTTAKKYYKRMQMSDKIDIMEEETEIDFYKHILKKYKKDLTSSEIEDLEEDIEDWKEDLKEYKKEYVSGRSGNFVWYGTKNAIEATK